MNTEIQQILKRLLSKEILDRQDAKRTLTLLVTEDNEYLKTAIVSAMTMRAPALTEIAGFRDAMLELSLPLDLKGLETADLCGTGGDGKNTFNISTLSALTAAAAGVRIAKHGNYGVSSQCGSSNVLEALGLKFPTTQSEVEASLDKAGIAFLHAPYFHPAMKAFAPLRKGLGMKTFFNTLGPIVNPARPQTKLLGVNSLALLRLYGFLHEGDQDQNEHSNFAIVHSLDGYDEISLTSPVRIITKAKDCILEPEDFLATRIKPEELVAGESIAANVSAFKRIISGQACLAEISVISANAGMLISLAQKVDLPTGILRAREALLSGKAQNILEKLIG